MGGAIFTFITQIRKPRLNLSWVTWPRGLLSLAFSFEKLMKCPCLFTTEGEEKEFFRALMPAAPAQPGWAASRSSRFQKGNDSLVFPLGKPFLIQSKLFMFLFFFKAMGSQACQTQLSFLLQILFHTLFTILGFPCGQLVKNLPAMQETWV